MKEEIIISAKCKKCGRVTIRHIDTLERPCITCQLKAKIEKGKRSK